MSIYSQETFDLAVQDSYISGVLAAASLLFNEDNADAAILVMKKSLKRDQLRIAKELVENNIDHYGWQFNKILSTNGVFL